VIARKIHDRSQPEIGLLLAKRKEKEG